RRARSPLSASKRQILSPTCISVRPRRGLPLRDRHRLPVEPRRVVLPRDEGVPEEVLVVTVGVIVRSSVGAAALLPCEAGDDHARGELEQVVELECLREIGVEHVALVLDDDALVPLPELVDDRTLLEHLLLAAEDAEVLVHRRRELVADLPRALAL